MSKENIRSYTNKKGEKVIVSESHLNTAVELKLKLQSDSPSNRCSWSQHKKLMEKEGYDNAENSENYRKMIQYYQKSIGELPSSETYADKVVSNKLESYKELVGEVRWEKLENQKYLRKINKGKREIVDGSLFIEEVRTEIRNVLSDVNWKDLAKRNFSPIKNHTGTRLVLMLTDWHIGALVDVEGNKYNLEIAQERINKVIEETMLIASERKVYRIDVVYMGDILEHAYMRNSQAYHAEFPVSEQMTKAGKLMIEILTKLSKRFFTTFRAFSGNHDRMNGDKNSNIDGDTGMVVVNEMVKLFIEMAEIDNLMYVECEKFSAKLIDVNGVNIKFVHGDLEKKSDTGKIHDHSSRDGTIYDVIAYGHFHHYMSLEVGINKFEIRVGSTKGSDDYSEKLGLGSAPSQAVLLVDPNGKIDSIRIPC